MKERSGMRTGNPCASFLFGFALLLLALAPGAAAQSQGGTGQIVGTVTDSTGAAVPGAKVTATSKSTGLVREAESNEHGQYRLILLPPGAYAVTVQRPGFKQFRSEVVVSVGATLTVNSSLEIGEMVEVIEVTAEVPIATTTSQSDALFNQKAISGLPINGRRFHDFVSLTPTVQIEPQRNGISFAGQRGINANVTIDGADYNEPFFGGIRGGERANNAFSIPQESIAEFQVVPYGYTAEFGRSSGGLMNAVTKSGSNEFHGSAFYFLRHKNLATNDAFEREAITDLHQLGGSFGGPIKRDKSYFFGSAEWQKNDNPRVVIFRRLEGVTRSAANAEAFDFYKNQEEPFTQTNDAVTALGKWDHDFTANHRVSARYNYSKNTAKNAVATGDAIGPETNRTLTSNGTEGDRVNNVVGTWTGIFSPRLINEFRSQFSREDRPRTANAQQAGITSFIGDSGTRNFLPTTAFNWRVQANNNLNWTTGNHSVKFGVDYNRLFINQRFGFDQFGFFRISGTNADQHLQIMSALAGTPLNRFDSTLVTYQVNIGNLFLEANQTELAFYVQDAWRVTPRFTINAGFRWEGYFNPSPDTSNTALTNLVRNFTFPLGRVNPGFIPDNLKQYMPRLGFAWDPRGNAKTVIRANAGIYYARTPLLLMAGPLNNFRTPPGDVRVQLPITGFATCAAAGVAPIAAGDTCNTVYWQMRRIGIDLNTIPLDNLPKLTFAQIQQIATALGRTVDPNQGLQPITWADNYESPRSWQWSGGIEHELFRGFTLGGEFAYLNTVHLQRNREFNLPTPVIPASDLSLRPCFGVRSGGPCGSRARPITSLGSVQVRESSARALYRAATFRAALRRSRYQFQAFYTLGKNLSNDDNERDAGGVSFENTYDLAAEYHYARLDVRHQFQFNGLMELPWGFTVSGLSRMRSSRPLSPTTGADSNFDFGGPDRPYLAPGVPFKRNSFRDRASYNVDMRLSKRFNLPREGMRFEFSADFFNLSNFDNVNFTSTGAIYGLGVSTAGAILTPDARFQRMHNPANCSPAVGGNKNCYDTTTTVPGSPFTMQLGFRFNF
jgi:outer membrane receptor protein involved in Fe transport